MEERRVYILPNGKIYPKLGIWEGKRQKPLVIDVDKLPAGAIEKIELTYDRGSMLAVSCDDGTLPKKSTGFHMAAIDPGEFYSIAAVCENGQGIMLPDNLFQAPAAERTNQGRPEHYARVRLASVVTTASLDYDEPLTISVCHQCLKCVRECPSGA
ncbi:hypothetical protein [Zhaonella formicivorans]|uniref:hypothetical protein n=1 Tax=Zhaonella formicivorans TaxID=2528593 RepID=UPI0010CF8623|nr:hypothetical protein [Zhaonella formicivorans]